MNASSHHSNKHFIVELTNHRMHAVCHSDGAGVTTGMYVTCHSLQKTLSGMCNLDSYCALIALR